MNNTPILLVVDDEEIERKMITSILKSHLEGKYRIQEASNGLAAIQTALEEAPQIIVMDIQMPVMNGLRAMEEIRKTDKDTFFIILTAHNEFEYAVSAVKIGVEDYILKPVRQKKLIEAIERIEEKKNALLKRGTDDWKKQFDFLFPYIEDSIISGTVMGSSEQMHLRQIFRGIFPKSGDFVLVSIENYPRETVPKELLEQLRERLIGHQYETLGACLGWQIVLVVQLLKSNDLKRIEDIILQTVNAEVKISEPVADADSLSLIYRRMAYSDQTNKPERISDAFSCAEKEVAVKIATQKKEQAWGVMDEMLFSYRSADTTLDALQKKLQTRCVVIDHYLEMTVGSVQLSPMIPFSRSPNREELRTAVRAYVEMRCADVQESQAHRTNDIIDQAITDMEEKYRDGFYSLNEAADNLKISPAYLSKVFKGHMGKTFTEYLRDIRIDEAKTLLHDTDLDISKIARRCGFNSANYFCKVYKKLTGTSASDYRSSLGDRYKK